VVRCMATRVTFAVLLLMSAACNESRAQQGDAWVTGTAGTTIGAGSTRFALVEARKEVRPSWNVGAAFAYLDVDAGRDEAQLRLMSINTMTTGRWAFDWRQMLSVSSRDLTRFRSRIRAARPGLLGRSSMSLRAYDELVVDLEGAGVIRNHIAAGFGLQLQERCSAELYHVWVDNRVGHQSDFELLLFTLRF